LQDLMIISVNRCVAWRKAPPSGKPGEGPRRINYFIRTILRDRLPNSLRSVYT